MISDSDVNVLVSAVLNCRAYSHCRLCLKEIETEYVRFDAPVTLDPPGGTFQPLSEVLGDLLGDEITDQVPGLDAVCTICMNSLLDATKFVKTCRNSTQLLQTVFSSLSEALNIHVEGQIDDQALYVEATKSEIKMMLMTHDGKTVTARYEEFECSECQSVLPNFDEYKNHHNEVHSLLTCEMCYLTFPTESALTFHTLSEHKGLFKCDQCKFTANTEEDVKIHSIKAHYLYQCSECDKTFQGLEKLQLHQSRHSRKHKCPNCQKSYITKDFFQKHVQLCLAGLLDPHPSRTDLEKKYNCEKCGKAYSTPGGLRVHNRFEHGNAKHHICHYCGKKFTAPSYLKPHMLKHTGEKNFVCNICGKKVVSKEALLYHTRRHTGEKPYKCKYCDEKFVNASTRAEHIKFKHVGPTLQCDICSRKFVTATFLKQHMKRHLDPTSKIYSGRNDVPPDMPWEQNMRVKLVHH